MTNFISISCLAFMIVIVSYFVFFDRFEKQTWGETITNSTKLFAISLCIIWFGTVFLFGDNNQDQEILTGHPDW